MFAQRQVRFASDHGQKFTDRRHVGAKACDEATGLLRQILTANHSFRCSTWSTENLAMNNGLEADLKGVKIHLRAMWFTVSFFVLEDNAVCQSDEVARIVNILIEYLIAAASD